MQMLLLGPFEAADDSGRPITIARRQERCLLAILLLEAGRSVSVDRLIDLLWDGLPPDSARGAVRVHIARLRSALIATSASIHTRGDGYLIEIDPLTVDVHRFVRAVE